MLRRHSTLDPGALGPDLLIDGGGNILTTDSAGLSFARSARGTIGQTRFTHSVEWLIYTPEPDGSEPTIDNKVSLGLVTSAASMSAYVGSAANSIGYRPAEGDIYLNGSSVASVDTAGLDDIVGMLVIFNEASVSVTWYKNGDPLHTEVLTSGWFGETLYWAASLGSDAAAGDILIFVNTGTQDFEFPIPNAEGWWTRPPAAPLIRIATRDVLSLPDDDEPNARYDGVILPGTQDARGVQFWPRGGAEPGGSGAALELALVNRDGSLDSLLTGAYAGLPVKLMRLPDGETSVDMAESLGEWIFERAEVIDDTGMRVIARDRMSQLDVPLQRARFLPNATESAANREKPVCIGTVWSLAPPVEIPDDDGTPPKPIYNLDNQGVSAIGRVRVRGQPLLPTGTPPAYELLPGGEQLRLDSSASDFPDGVITGVLTLDLASVGVAFDPGVAPDALDDDAFPFTGVNLGAIDHFSEVILDSGTGGTHDVRFRTGGFVEFTQNGGEPESYIEHEDFVFAAGSNYLLGLGLVQIEEASPEGLLCRVGFSTNGRYSGYIGWVDSNSALGAHLFPYSCVTSHALRVAYDGNNTVGGTACRIENVRVWLVPPVDNDQEDELVENALPRIGVEAYMREVIEDRGDRLQPSDWDSTDAAAIDAELDTPAVGLGTVQQITMRDALDAIMPGICASLYRKPDGRIGVTRMVKPEDVVTSETDPASEFTIDRALMRRPLQMTPDTAQALTKQIGARYNERILTEADLDTPDAVVPLRLSARLGRQCRYIRSSAVQVAVPYLPADNRPPLATRLADPEDAQVLADFVADYYATPRMFYVVDIPSIEGVDIGAVGWLRYPFHGLSVGVPVVIEHITRDLVFPFWPVVVLSGPAPGALG